jgi:hypothetical protein
MSRDLACSLSHIYQTQVSKAFTLLRQLKEFRPLERFKPFFFFSVPVASPVNDKLKQCRPAPFHKSLVPGPVLSRALNFVLSWSVSPVQTIRTIQSIENSSRRVFSDSSIAGYYTRLRHNDFLPLVSQRYDHSFGFSPTFAPICISNSWHLHLQKILIFSTSLLVFIFDYQQLNNASYFLRLGYIPR